ncbi:hypothetical protein GCM10010406_31140 [Streptomyces thermolineatus]|uniref:Uncharacterized protein n=1 Tax=Streptomyces thermolineatus TaxID=44033 RepID=A0ABN3M1T7_9ACTN
MEPVPPTRGGRAWPVPRRAVLPFPPAHRLFTDTAVRGIAAQPGTRNKVHGPDAPLGDAQLAVNYGGSTTFPR